MTASVSSRADYRWLATIAALAFLGGIFLHAAVAGHGAVQSDKATGATQSSPAARSVSVSATGPGPARTEHGVPAGFSRTRDGAIAAAGSYVCTGQALVDLDPIAAEDGVRQMAASSSADRQVHDTLDGLTRVRNTLASGTGPVVFRQLAVAWRVDAFSTERARVAIWNVGILSRDGVAPPQAGWATSTFDLVWERADWKVAAETIVPGPAPVLNDSTAPATSAQLEAALQGFTDFGVRQ